MPRPSIPRPIGSLRNDWNALRDLLGKAGLELNDGEAVERRLTELRGMYEPFVTALSLRFLMPLPPVLPDGRTRGQLANQRLDAPDQGVSSAHGGRCR